MNTTKPLLATIIVFGLLTGLCSAFTFTSGFTYLTNGGASVRFSRDIAAGKWDQSGTLTRFTNINWNGEQRGVLMVDGTSTNITFTSLQENVLIYTVGNAGASTQTINYRGYGRPSSVQNATFVMTGNNIVVTTAGSTTVTITWKVGLNSVANQLMMFLGIFAMIPIGLASLGLRGVMNGTVDEEEFKKLVLACAGVVLTLLIIGIFLSQLT